MRRPVPNFADMTTLTPEQEAKLYAIIDARPPMSDDSIRRVAAIIAGIRQRQRRQA